MATSLPPAPAPARPPRTLLVATALAVVGGIALFGALLGLYLDARDAAGGTTATWLPGGVAIPERRRHDGLLTLVSRRHRAVGGLRHRPQRPPQQPTSRSGSPLLFGLAFMNSMAYIYRTMGLDIRRGRSTRCSVFSLTGTHFLVLLGRPWCSWPSWPSARWAAGTPSGDRGPHAAALYWHFTVVAFVAIWAIVFV